jgi:hypothetical protein
MVAAMLQPRACDDLLLPRGHLRSQAHAAALHCSQAAAADKARARALQPYLISAPTHGIIGNSRFASRLRKEVVGAAREEGR